MIQYLAKLLLRVLVETAVIFLSVAAVLLVLAWRIGRRTVVSGDGVLETVSGRALQALQLIPRRAPSTNGAAPVVSEPEFDEFDEEEPA